MLCILFACSLIQEALTPPLSSVDMFAHIDRGTIRQCMAHNRMYRCHLSEVLKLYPQSNSASLAMKDADMLYRAWDALDDATSIANGAEVRRNALRQLQCIIGSEDFYLGIMPFPVPEWALTAIR